MPHVFVYEFLSGGGLLDQSQPPGGPLLAEGWAMAKALAADFAALEGVRVSSMRDGRLEARTNSRSAVQLVTVNSAHQELAVFDRLAGESDWTVVIAPEFSGNLYDRCRRVELLGGRLLGPDARFVRLAADKHDLAEYLRSRGAPAPGGVALAAGESPLNRGVPFPAVVKPRDGAGCEGVRVFHSAADLGEGFTVDAPSRFEKYHEGLPVSVGIIAGRARRVFLPACRQRLRRDEDGGAIHYAGGPLPLPPPLARRTENLAMRAADVLPAWRGYIGLDMVLSHDASGSHDVVIEVNPRLTTSYVGLRAACQDNLANVMLRLASGERGVPHELSFRSGAVEFDAGGTP